jgi:signal transduction histidine kinase
LFQGASRRLIAAFVLLLVLPAAAVVWLGVRLVIQDRELETKQLREQRERTAERVVAELTEHLAEAERTLSSSDSPGDDAIKIAIIAGSIRTYPTTRLLYYPSLGLADDTTDVFTAGEALEWVRGDFEGAEAAFRRLVGERSERIKAGAIVRLARVLRKKGAHRKALPLYDDLARLTHERIDGVPAALVARRARCVVFAELNETAALRKEAAALRAELVAGAWHVDRGTFVQYDDELTEWLGSVSEIPSSQKAIAEAVHWLWERRDTNGQQAVRLADVDFTLVWQSTGDELHALILGPAFQQRHWFSAFTAETGDNNVQVAFASSSGIVSGAVREIDTSLTLRRPSTQTGLPWDVIVRSGDSLSVGPNRRLAILFGLGFLVLLVIAGGYLMARAVSRELAVARLQSDFVASVSHEFRTPLTSLRQFTDLLTEADDLTPDKRRHFLAAQSRATDRLQRLVESLLDFRRMESGTHPYRRQRLAASNLVEGVVEEFRPEAAARGFEIEYSPDADDRAIDADPEAMSLALWNLLDNAVKYSGDSRRVSVSMAANNGSIEIRIQDRGLGVPRDEQHEIFRQFVRGREARKRGIKGTGIGLAMVQHIVRGHDGRVTLESAPGEGSTFTIVLPACLERAPSSRGATV